MSTSSSSLDRNFYNVRNASYILDCIGMSSFSNPLIGKDCGVFYQGWFETEDSSYRQFFKDDNSHFKRGGLKRTFLNNGAIYSNDASKLFFNGSGTVAIRLSLPYDIVGGIYSPCKHKITSQ